VNIDDLYERIVKEVTERFHDQFISTGHRYAEETMHIAETYVRFIVDEFTSAFWDEREFLDE
jgi:hypothetical protein